MLSESMSSSPAIFWDFKRNVLAVSRMMVLEKSQLWPVLLSDIAALAAFGKKFTLPSAITTRMLCRPR